jgi:tRNA (cmo5U34)-methyltransferase
MTAVASKTKNGFITCILAFGRGCQRLADQFSLARHSLEDALCRKTPLRRCENIGMAARKSTPDEIRKRFDADVERFSNLDTGQSATVDASLGLELIASAAAAVTPAANTLLDVGCGAGNYSLKLAAFLPLRSITLIDLSKPMLDRAVERIAAAFPGVVTTAVQADIREVVLPPKSFDVAVAAATLHHLRADDEWRRVFAGIYRLLKPGGSFWIWDLVMHEPPALHELMWQRYGEYLSKLKGPDYRDQVFTYIDAEDTPRPLAWQLDLLRGAGFGAVEVLHKNICFAAFGGLKAE